MPQESLLYAIGRLRMLRRQLLSAAQLQRLLNAPDYTEAQRVLLEAGYITQEQPDAELASIQRHLAALREVRALSPEPATTDSFLLRNDANNLKIYFKARLLEEEPEGISPGGTLNPELLRHAVNERSYTRLPQPLREAMTVLEQRTATQVNPMEIDVLIDKALYRMMAEGMKHSRSPRARQWVSMRTDFANLRALLRLQEMQTGLSVQQVLLPGGEVPTSDFVADNQAIDRLVLRFRRLYGAEFGALAQAASDSPQAIGPLEKRMEELLGSLFTPARMEPESLDAVLDYLLAVEKESAAVRLIMAGKRNGMSVERIEQRLRSGYGR